MERGTIGVTIILEKAVESVTSKLRVLNLVPLACALGIQLLVLGIYKAAPSFSSAEFFKHAKFFHAALESHPWLSKI